MSTVLRADGLGKKYRRRWALSDCTLDIPAYPEDSLPPELAAIPAIKPGSRGLAA